MKMITVAPCSCWEFFKTIIFILIFQFSCLTFSLFSAAIKCEKYFDVFKIFAREFTADSLNSRRPADFEPDLNSE